LAAINQLAVAISAWQPLVSITATGRLLFGSAWRKHMSPWSLQQTMIQTNPIVVVGRHENACSPSLQVGDSQWFVFCNCLSVNRLEKDYISALQGGSLDNSLVSIE
jgi:hypothetical protein